MECLVLTILTLTKYLQNLLRYGTLSLISIEKKSSLDDAKNAKRQFFFDTRYHTKNRGLDQETLFFWLTLTTNATRI